MRENDPQREQMGRLLKSRKVRGFLTIHALLMDNGSVHVFPDAEKMPKDLAVKSCELAIEQMYDESETI